VRLVGFTIEIFVWCLFFSICTRHSCFVSMDNGSRCVLIVRWHYELCCVPLSMCWLFVCLC